MAVEEALCISSVMALLTLSFDDEAAGVPCAAILQQGDFLQGSLLYYPNLSIIQTPFLSDGIWLMPRFR